MAKHHQAQDIVFSISDVDSRQQVLLAAIDNVQKTILSLEARVPMALVLHGLLFAGLLSVTTGLAKFWPHDWTHWVLAPELAVTGLAFLISVLAFIACVAPPPRSTFMVPSKEIGFSEDQEHLNVHPGLFFPPWKWKFGRNTNDDGKVRFIKFTFLLEPTHAEADYYGQSGPTRLLATTYRGLDSNRLEKMLVAELTVVSTFRAYKSAVARVGFWWLRVEIVAGLTFLATLGIARLAGTFP